MEVILPLILVAIIVGAVVWKNKPEWVEKVKSWIK
tara:strand:- start:169 stop:273 length:105 start_codon:yes stop_codon:yes gene_type:complete